jgi:uncharacterized membrane protein (DUF485 family)
MGEKTCKWDAIYAHPEFQDLVSRRRAVVLRLFIVSMLCFFSVPLIVVFQPDVFKISLGGAINVGLIYLVAQYVVGTAIALRYTALLMRLDGMADRLSGHRHTLAVAVPAH